MKSNKIKKLLGSKEIEGFSYKNYIKKLLVINFLPCLIIAVINLLLITNVLSALIINFVVPIVLPIYLLIVNTKIALLYKKKFFILNLLFIFFALFFMFATYYLEWGIYSKRLLHPDTETVYILFLEVQIAIIIILFGSLISSIILFFKQKKRS